MRKTNFENWSIELEKVWDLENEAACVMFSQLMYSLTGNEEVRFLNKLIDAVRLKDDYGLYESLYNAVWVFPPNLIGETLAQRLPEFQKRMGKFDQVSRFYIAIPINEVVQNAFLEEAKNWTIAEKRTSLSALNNWYIEDENWSFVLDKLGKPSVNTKADPIPDHWDDNWKKRFETGRKKGGAFSISDIFWKKGKKVWLEDLDFLIETLGLNLGKDWRQIDTMTNPLWFFAKTTVYPLFVEKLKKLPCEKQVKVLDNIKKVNKQKYKQLNEELNSIE